MNGRLNCFITILRDSALLSARESQARFDKGHPIGLLDGIPIALKDLFYIRGVRCTAGSKILSSNVAAYDSQAVAKLKAAGAVIVGTTNLHEFAAGVTSVNPHFGAVRNPWDESRISGGSSGGSAVAVASGMVAATLGSDTAGSVRIPAALCGTLGLKPTYGRISRLGVVPLASSFDTVGTLTSGAWDAALLLQVLSGGDPTDVTVASAEVPDYLAPLSSPFQGAKVGVPRKYFHDLLAPGVEREFGRFIRRLEDMGCTVEDADFEGIDEAYGVWLPIRRAEATAFHLKWLGTSPELYGDDVRRSLEAGKEISAVEYINAQNARPLLIERFAASMKDFDAMVVPTTAIPAPPIGKESVELDGRDVEVYSALNRLTLPFNVVGFPAVSIPSGFVDGLPVGAQLIGRPFEEPQLLRIAHAYELKMGGYPDPGGVSS